MLANEMYLDSVDIRKNIVSLAKSLVIPFIQITIVNVDITLNKLKVLLTMNKELYLQL